MLKATESRLLNWNARGKGMARAGWALMATSIYHLESSIIYLPSVVGPATELEFAFLIIKREPCNVYLARALKDARRYVEAAPSLIHHHVRLERAVELFVGAAGVRGRGARSKY